MGASSDTAANSRETALVYSALTAQTLISAATYLAASRAMEEIPPLTLVICRFAVSTVCFVALLLVRGAPRVPPKAELLRVLGLGVLAGPINQGFFFLGLAKSTPAHAALLYALTPLGVYLVMLSRRQERMHAGRMLGIAIAFSGVAVLLLGRGLQAAFGPLIGDLSILVAVVAWVFYTADGKALAERLGPMRATAWTMIAGALLSFPFAPLVFKSEAVFHAT
ncbi:MAG: DMT family transporter, partial [Myxococcaceae bacterium]